MAAAALRLTAVRRTCSCMHTFMEAGYVLQQHCDAVADEYQIAGGEAAA